MRFSRFGVRWFALALTSCLVLGLAGCGGTGINFLDNFGKVVVEPIGKSFSTLNDRVKFDVPSGAFASAVTFSILQASGLPLLSFLMPASAFNLIIDGGQPLKPFSVLVGYDPTAIPGGGSEQGLRLFQIVNGQPVLVEGSIVLPEQNAVQASVQSTDGTFVVGVSVN